MLGIDLTKLSSSITSSVMKELEVALNLKSLTKEISLLNKNLIELKDLLRSLVNK